jgi:hypothetical protein
MWKGEHLMFLKLITIIATIIRVLMILAFSFGVWSLIFLVLCYLLGVTFSWKIAFASWIVLNLLKGIFKTNND